jgi:hypothetical protein
LFHLYLIVIRIACSHHHHQLSEWRQLALGNSWQGFHHAVANDAFKREGVWPIRGFIREEAN